MELTTPGRHHNHYLWLHTQSYSAILKDLGRQAKAKFFWYPKEGVDLKIRHYESNVLTDDELVVVTDFIKK